MSGPRYRTVLFDCDGTLLNTIADLSSSVNRVCRAHGWPGHDVEACKRMVGDGQRVLVERFVPAGVAADPAALDAAYREFVTDYEAHKEDETAPYEGVREVLVRLRGAGVRLGVLTNKNHEQAVPLVERFFPGLIDAVRGRVDGLAPKPDPQMTLSLMGSLQADAASTLMVGDTSVDVACGKNVGADACGVLWGFRGEDELRHAGADVLAAVPADLLGIVLG